MSLAVSPLEFIKCDLCGSLDHRLQYRKKSRFRDMTFSICSCRHCGLFFVNPRLPESMVAEVYSEAYYNGLGVDANFRGESEGKLVDATLLVKSLEKIMKSTSLRILDVGGGAGLVSHVAKERGHMVEFSDLSPAAVSRAKSKGLTAHLAKPEDLIATHAGQFDVIVALEVIEHVYSPKEFLSSIHALLRTGGLWAFTTGNVSESAWRGINWGYFDIPEAHLYFFSSQTMDRYLGEVGFTRRISPYRYFFKRWWGLRLLEKCRLVKLSHDCEAKTILQHWSLWLLERLERAVGRRRFDWAIK
jgi:SAM-dependent methyltransferase